MAVVGRLPIVRNPLQATRDMKAVGDVQRIGRTFLLTHNIKQPQASGAYGIKSRQEYADLVAQDNAFTNLLRRMKLKRNSLVQPAAIARADAAIAEVQAARPPSPKDCDIIFKPTKVGSWYRNTIPKGMSSWITRIKYNKIGSMDVNIHGKAYNGFPATRNKFIQWIGQIGQGVKGGKNNTGIGSYFNKNVKMQKVKV